MPGLFDEIANNGTVKPNEDKKMMVQNIEAWKQSMKTEAIDIRDALLVSCRNSSWVHQRLMTTEQLRNFLEIVNAVKAKYAELTNDSNPNTEMMADAIIETINEGREF
jgi:Zn-finger protein